MLPEGFAFPVMVAYLPRKEPYREVADRDDERDAERELERGEEVVVLVHDLSR